MSKSEESKQPASGLNQDDVQEGLIMMKNDQSGPALNNINGLNAEEKKRIIEEQERAKRVRVRKVSAVTRCCSSIRTRYFSVVAVFVLVSAVLVASTGLVAILYFYEDMDTLDMQERVQNAVGGVQSVSNIFFARALMVMEFIGEPFRDNDFLRNNVPLAEQIMSMMLYNSFNGLVEGPRLLTDYSFVPVNLVMIFDENWNERLVYYLPCENPENNTFCDIPSFDKIFADYANGNFTLLYKDKVPDYFKKIKDVKPSHCDEFEKCCGIAMIPEEQGGPMMFSLYRMKSLASRKNVLEGWYMLWGFNMKFLNPIAANRTGLCVSSYSSLEKNLPKVVEKELETKRNKNLLVNPHEASYNENTNLLSYYENSDVITMAQDYYSNTVHTYKSSDRQICDDYYDHGGDLDIAKTHTYLAYRGFDLASGKNIDNESFIYRFDYHDPHTSTHFRIATRVVFVLMAVWVLTNAGVGVYFNFAFLVPLDKIRDMRADLIKSSLAGLDDDGILAKELFGDMIDDSALIEANGDEITVMLTLQDRIDAFYSSLIKSRTHDLRRFRAGTRRELNAVRIMNLFMRRDDENIRSILPGLIDTNDVARFRRTADAINPKGGFAQDYMNARHTFRSFKTILSNDIATEFFKAYCFQRGRTTMNSLFFLMDVGWLNQVENSARSDADDFFTSLFSDSVSPSSASISPLTSPRLTARFMDSMDQMDPLFSERIFSEPQSPRMEPDRPRHSHFTKSKGNEKETKPLHTPSSSDESGEEQKRRLKVPYLNLSGLKGSPSSPPLSPQTPQDSVPFLTTNGKTIAQFIYSSYFGRKSLAQRDMKHSALLGCSQIPDYISLRDKKTVVYSPIMYNNLVTAVTKKFISDVIPQFLESCSFQLLVYCLLMTNYFEKTAEKKSNPKEQQAEVDGYLRLKRSTVLVNSVWGACQAKKKPRPSSSTDGDSILSTDVSDGDEDAKDDNNGDTDDDDDDNEINDAVDVKL